MKAHHFISIATTYVIPLLIIILSYARLLSHITANQKNLVSFSIIVAVFILVNVYLKRAIRYQGRD